MRTSCGALCALAAVFVSFCQSASGDESQVRKALASPTALAFKETPLQEAAAYLADRHDINIVLDVKALEGSGIPLDSPITATLSHTALGSTLRLLLDQLNMDYVVRDAVLIFTTKEEAEGSLTVAVHPVADLLQLGTADAIDPDSLLEVVVSTCEPNSWEDVGGRAVAKIAAGRLIVRQSTLGHETISQMLIDLRQRSSKPKEADSIQKALERKVSFDFKQVSLTDVADFLRSRAGVDVLIDNAALDDIGVPSDTIVTSKRDNVPLRDALATLLRPLELTALRRHGVLLITAQEEAKQMLEPRVYDVGGLINPAANEATASLDMGELTDLLFRTVDPISWDEVGGPGSLAPIGDLLVVTQTEQGHRNIESLLHTLHGLPQADIRHLRPNAAVQAALDKRLSCKFVHTPLEDAVAWLRGELGVNVQINSEALADIGVAVDAPVALKLEHVQAELLLDLLLRPHNLGWTTSGPILEVTSQEGAHERTESIYYDLGAVVDANLSNDELLELVTSTVEPDSWEQYGGQGAAVIVRDAMIVLQTPRNQRRVAALLKRLSNPAAEKR